MVGGESLFDNCFTELKLTAEEDNLTVCSVNSRDITLELVLEICQAMARNLCKVSEKMEVLMTFNFWDRYFLKERNESNLI